MCKVILCFYYHILKIKIAHCSDTYICMYVYVTKTPTKTYITAGDIKNYILSFTLQKVGAKTTTTKKTQNSNMLKTIDLRGKKVNEKRKTHRVFLLQFLVCQLPPRHFSLHFIRSLLQPSKRSHCSMQSCYKVQVMEEKNAIL